MQWYLKVLKNYVGFSGRARRKEYWLFQLFNIIAIVILAFIDQSIFGQSSLILTCIYLIATLLPSLAVVVRRLHDTSHSGWWWFIQLIPIVGPIVLLVFMCKDSTPASNKYGANPKTESAL